MCRLEVLFVVSSLVFLPNGLRGQDQLIPEGAEDIGLERITPDTIVYEHDGNLSNWEPYTSVLGSSAFLIESNTFALDEDGEIDPFYQRFALAIQPVDGREGVRGECFFDDDGNPYPGRINSYRQDGNPGRVAGDKRPGAVNFITGAEANPNEFDEFQSDDRWELGLVRNGRFAAVQTFSLNLEMLEQKAESLAIDAINGRLEEGDPGTGEIGRFGGELAGLSDGNFLVVVDDRSSLHFAGTATTAVILAPDGSVVRESFVIEGGDIWSNVAAYQDGFCVRKGGLLKFFDNEGELEGEIDQSTHDLQDSEGNFLDFDRGRGDGTRIAGHINSPYVFLAGAIKHLADGIEVEDVYVAVYDAHDQSFVAAVNVNELTDDHDGTDDVDFRADADRVGVAVDALNRVVVVWEVKLPDTFLDWQTVARVLAFDGETGSFEYLTPTFFPFVNFQNEDLNVLAVRTTRPSVSMTTREICVAAKGQINAENLPEDGADTPEVNFYTVFRHPDPRDDPTPPVGGPPQALVRGGDVNFDGTLNISDPVAALGFLFAGESLTECYVVEEGDAMGLTGTGLAVLDWNGDGDHDLTDAVGSLTFQFGGGPAHALGQECAMIEGSCEDHCGQ